MIKVTRLSFIILFFIAVYSSACKNTIPDEVQLFNGYKFQKDSSEIVFQIDSLEKATYEQYFNNVSEIQLPLYRVIKGKDYVVYLGIPFHSNIKKLSKARQDILSSDTTFLYNNQDSFSFCQYKKDSLFFIEYIRNLDSNSVICVFGITKNQQAFHSIFNQSNLSSRIIK